MTLQEKRKVATVHGHMLYAIILYVTMFCVAIWHSTKYRPGRQWPVDIRMYTGHANSKPPIHIAYTTD